MATELAQAYVQIIPSMKGVQEQLTKEFGGAAEKAGDNAGHVGGSSFLGKLGKVVAGGAAAALAGLTAAAGSLISNASEVAAYGDEIDKMSQKLGLSAKTYQEWDYVLGQAGADITSMSTGIKTLTNKLDDAKNGSTAAQEMFAKLGLSMEDLNSMSREDIFENVIYGFQDMADSTERAALANDLFGKSGQELTPLFNSSVEETKALIEASNELGFVMSDEAVKAAADYQDALDTMTRTMGGLKNKMLSEFMPSLTTVMDGLTQIFAGDSESGMGMIKEGISGLVTQLSESMPQILELGVGIVTALSTALIENLPTIMSAGMDALFQFVSGVLEQLPQLIEAGMQVIATLIIGIAQALPTLIPQMVAVVMQMVQTLIENLPLILDAALQLIQGLAQGILDAIPVLIEALPDVIMGIVNFLLDSIPQIIEAGIKLLTSLIDALPTIIQTIVEAIPKIIDGIITAVIESIPQIIEAGIKLLISLVQALPQIITTIVQALPKIIDGIVNGLIGNIDKIIMAGVQLFVALIENLPTIIVEIVKAVPQIIAGIVKAFVSMMGKIVEVGANIVKGLWDGIKQLATWLWDKVSGWIKSIWDGILNFFGISSPSKEMAWVGEMMVKGLSGSIEDNGDEAVKAAEVMSENIDGVMQDLAWDMSTALPTDAVKDAITDIGEEAVGTFNADFTYDRRGMLEDTSETNENILSAILQAANMIVTAITDKEVDWPSDDYIGRVATNYQRAQNKRIGVAQVV